MQGKFGSAVAAGEQALKWEPSSAKAWLAIARGYVGMQSFDKALEMLNGAVLSPLKIPPIIGVPKPYQTTVPPGLRREAWSMDMPEQDEEVCPGRPWQCACKEGC